jgi:hypothetical protein
LRDYKRSPVLLVLPYFPFSEEMSTQRAEYIAKLYAWLATNKIDIEYGKGKGGTDAETAIIERVVKQIGAELIDPTPELLDILDGIARIEVGTAGRSG